MAAVSSKEAAAYLIDPLTAPEPSAETGPGSHFVAPSESDVSVPRSSLSSNNPFRSRRSTVSSTHSRHRSSGSDSQFHTPERLSTQSGTPPSYEVATGQSSHRRRRSSLNARFPGDESHKPLAILRKDSKKAHRSPHLNKRHMPGADSIDRLDPTVSSVPYHHEGPYDAAALARNTKKGAAPIDALKESNREALKATPPENIKNSIERHVPLDGVAQVPPGAEDRFGRTYQYEEGGNQMIEGDPAGGAYKRWPGVKYHPDDIKGKGEPSYSQDIAARERGASTGKDERGDIELADQHHAEGDASGRARSGSFADGLKKRIGSLKKKNRRDE